MTLVRVSSYLIEKQETPVSEQLTDGETVAETTENDEPTSESTGAARPSKVQRLEHLAVATAELAQVGAADLHARAITLHVHVEVAVEVGDLEELLEVVGGDLALLLEAGALALHRCVGRLGRLRVGGLDLFLGLVGHELSPWSGVVGWTRGAPGLLPPFLRCDRVWLRGC